MFFSKTISSGVYDRGIDPRPWVVVSYLEDEGALAVPSTWLFFKEGQQFAWYPPRTFKPSEVTLAIDRRDSPDEEQGWTSLLADVVAYSSTLPGAQKKVGAFVRRLEIVNSSEAEKKKKLKRSSHDTPGSSQMVKKPKQSNPEGFKKDTGKKKQIRTLKKKDNNEPISFPTRRKQVRKGEQQPPSDSSDISDSTDSSSDEQDSSFSDIEISDEDIIQNLSEDRNSTDEDDDAVNSVPSAAKMLTNKARDGKKLDEHGSKVLHPENCCPCSTACCPCALEERKVNARFRRRMCRAMAALKAFIENKHKAAVGPAPSVEGVHFPMSTIEEVQLLNCQVTANKKLSSSLIQHFSFFNDTGSIHNTVNSVIEAIMDDGLVEKFNFDGKGKMQKIGLRKQYPKVVDFCVDVMRYNTGFSASEVVARMQVYFRRIKEKNRKKQEVPAPDNILLHGGN